jgi:hypothetical protein
MWEGLILRPIMFPKRLLMAGCIFLSLLGCIRAGDAVPPGFVEGHLKIVSFKTVELAEGNTSKVATVNHADYPLLILSKVGHKEVARVTADKDGNYRVALPPGDYILDVRGRASARSRSRSRLSRIRPSASTSIWTLASAKAAWSVSGLKTTALPFSAG